MAPEIFLCDCMDGGAEQILGVATPKNHLKVILAETALACLMKYSFGEQRP